MGHRAEMPPIQQPDLHTRHIGTKRLRPRRDEYLIPLAPHRQHGALRVAQPRLPGRVQVHIGAVIVEEIELGVSIARAAEESVVALVGHRGVDAWQPLLGGPERVLPRGRFEGQQGRAEGFVIGGAVGAAPEGAERVPEGAEAGGVGVAVLGDDGGGV